MTVQTVNLQGFVSGYNAGLQTPDYKSGVTDR